ncbi:carboxymuconolactone decarboxylase family protein [Lipomyces doorenjongii]
MNAQVLTTALDMQPRRVASTSALTAVGNLGDLKTALQIGLDAGLTVNEIKEVLDRKAQGVLDVVGKDASPLSDTTDDYERGRKVLSQLSKRPQPKPAAGFGEFAPRIDNFLKVHLFAHIFGSDVLTYQQRELVTISALAAMEGVEPQLQAHLSMGLNVGISVPQLIEAFDVIEKDVSKTRADAAKAILSKIKHK